MEYWDLWYPEAAATGMPFARGQVDQGVSVMLVHAAPPVLHVTVHGDDGKTLAEGVNLHATDKTPITRLVRRGDQVQREDIWPSETELGQLVMLPGGEVGTMISWWHAKDQSEWRWQIELYNHT